MLKTCLFCHQPFPGNQTLERFCANAHALRTIQRVMSWVRERSPEQVRSPDPELDM
jgi:hypothetical protein